MFLIRCRPLGPFILVAAGSAFVVLTLLQDTSCSVDAFQSSSYGHTKQGSSFLNQQHQNQNQYAIPAPTTTTCLFSTEEEAQRQDLPGRTVATTTNDDDSEKDSNSDNEDLGQTQQQNPIRKPSPRRNNYRSNNKLSIDLRSYEEKEKREMEWLVETTAKILGLDIDDSFNQPLGTASAEEDEDESATETIPSTPAEVGSMSPILTRRAFKLMRAWALRSGEPHVVELILKRLINESEAGNPHVKITTETYNVVLDAWSISRDPGAPERAETILNEMFKRQNEEVKPNVKSYNAVMMAYVDSDKWKDKSYPKVQAIFDRLVESSKVEQERADRERQYGTSSSYQYEILSPTRMSYNLLLSAIANSALADATERSEAILRTMLEEYNNGDRKAKPDIRSYNHVLRAWACYLDSNGRSQEAKTLEIFEELRSMPDSFNVRPNADTFNLILRLYLKSNNPKRLEKLEGVVDLMEECYEKGDECARPDRFTINTIVTAYAKSGKRQDVERALTLGGGMERKYGVLPDTVSNNIVMGIWSKSGHPDASWKALQILDAMEIDFKKGKLHLKPDAYTYSSVIDGFARVGDEDSAEYGQEVLERMRILHRDHGGDPANTSVYNAAINAWASSGSGSAAFRAQAILSEMEARHSEDPFVPTPDTTSYNTVIKALSRGGSRLTERAEELLQQMEANEKFGVGPDAFSYTALITAYGRSSLEMKAENAYKVLLRQIAAYERGNLAARPNILTFNSLLNACAFVNGKSARKVEAFAIMVAATNLLKKFTVADQTTYGTILRCCSTLLPPGDTRRTELVDTAFRKACDEGKVGQLVLKQLKFAAAGTQYQDLLGRNTENSPQTSDLPYAWTCNVRENRRRRPRQ